LATLKGFEPLFLR